MVVEGDVVTRMEIGIIDRCVKYAQNQATLPCNATRSSTSNFLLISTLTKIGDKNSFGNFPSNQTLIPQLHLQIKLSWLPQVEIHLWLTPESVIDPSWYVDNGACQLTTGILNLKNVLYVLEIAKNLMSVSKKKSFY